MLVVARLVFGLATVFTPSHVVSVRACDLGVPLSLIKNSICLELDKYLGLGEGAWELVGQELCHFAATANVFVNSPTVTSNKSLVSDISSSVLLVFWALAPKFHLNNMSTYSVTAIVSQPCKIPPQNFTDVFKMKVEFEDGLGLRKGNKGDSCWPSHFTPLIMSPHCKSFFN